MHVHVLAGGAEAKFDLESGECIAVYGFTRKTVLRLSKIVLKHKMLFIEAWNKYDGETEI